MLPCRRSARRLRAVVARATDSDPCRRHESVEELAADLRHCLVGTTETPAVFVPTRNPYRGLAAFEQADAADFFGRGPRNGGDGRDPWRAAAVVRCRSVRHRQVVSRQSRAAASVGPRRDGQSEAWLVTEMVPGVRRSDNLPRPWRESRRARSRTSSAT